MVCALKEFLKFALDARVAVTRLKEFRFSYDRVKFGGWNYYAFYFGFFKIMVSK